MATMFPAYIDQFTTAGEREVYEFFRRAARPDNDFLSWYSPDIKDREPDFILLSPDCGLIVFEVKDWAANQILELDPKTALLRIGALQERRKQPLAQAREYVYKLLSLLGKHGRQPGKPDIPVTYGGVFTRISKNDFQEFGLGKVIDEKRMLFQDDLLEDSPLSRDKSGSAMRQWLKDHFPPLFAFSLTSSGLALIRGAIFPVVRLNLPPRAGVEYSVHEEIITSLDHEQENMARHFGSGKTLLTGPSGSGKTLILAHQAWHLPRMDKKIKRILLTCFNLALVGYIRRLLARKEVPLGPNGVEVLPFYGLCEKILGEPLAHANESPDYYELVTRETLSRVAGGHPLKGHWDAILVDEGQDFSEDMARVLLELLPAHGSLTVVEDDRQKLYPQGSGWESLDIPGLKKRYLRRQYRNTRQIASLAAKTLNAPGGDEMFCGGEGPEPRWLKSEKALDQAEDVAEAVASLVRQGQAMSEIAVLYAKSSLPDGGNLPEALIAALEARGVLSRWMARDAASKLNYDITTDSVTISTIHSAKGLDFAHVFLLGLDRLKNDYPGRRLAYVGMTRARASLVLSIASDEGLAAELAKAGGQK